MEMERKVKEEMLCALLDGEKRFTKLMELLERPNRTIYNNLQKLMERGFVEKVDRGLYGLTDEGRAEAERTSLNRQIETRKPELQEWADSQELKEKVRRKLHISGFAMDLQKPRSAKSIIASGGMLAFKDLIRTFSGLTEPENEYLDFSAHLFIDSPREYLGKEDLNWLELESAWRAARPDAWRNRDRREGFDFDFPRAWKTHKKERSGELKEKMEELGLDSYEMFRGLRVFSFPLREKFKIVKENARRIAVPPEELPDP